MRLSASRTLVPPALGAAGVASGGGRRRDERAAGTGHYHSSRRRPESSLLPSMPAPFQFLTRNLAELAMGLVEARLALGGATGDWEAVEEEEGLLSGLVAAGALRAAFDFAIARPHRLHFAPVLDVPLPLPTAANDGKGRVLTLTGQALIEDWARGEVLESALSSLLLSRPVSDDWATVQAGLEAMGTAWAWAPVLATAGERLLSLGQPWPLPFLQLYKARDVGGALGLLVAFDKVEEAAGVARDFLLAAAGRRGDPAEFGIRGPAALPVTALDHLRQLLARPSLKGPRCTPEVTFLLIMQSFQTKLDPAFGFRRGRVSKPLWRTMFALRPG